MKIIVYLLILGLALTPFAITKGADSRVPKEIVAFMLALAIGLLALYNGNLKKFDNFWLLLLIGYFFVSMIQAPHFKGFVLGHLDGRELAVIGDRSISGFWAFKPYLYAVVYLLLMITVASCQFSSKEVRMLIFVMAGCGFIMALYVFLQALGMDQIFRIVSTKVNPDVYALDQPLLGGFLGQSTIVSPFIVMTIPLALCLRKYLWALIMAIAVCLTESKVAMGSMIAGCALFFLMSRGWKFKTIGILVVIVVLVGTVFFISQHPDRNWGIWLNGVSSGRIPAWARIWEDFNTPVNGKRHVLTGFGPGAYNFTFSIRHESRFWQAHNEPLEFLYNFGIAGVFLLFMGLRSMIKQRWSEIWAGDRTLIALLCSFVCIFLAGLGTFPFQIAPMMFYTTVIMGLLHNQGAREWIIPKS